MKNSTFNLPTLQFILKGIKGNNYCVGLTDNTYNYGLVRCNGTASFIGIDKNTYGQYKNNSYNVSWSTQPPEYTIGLTTDSTKSGIESDIDNNVKYVIKY